METAVKIQKRTRNRIGKPSILFWLRKNKTNVKGEAPINIRITVKGKRTDISTGILIPCNAWATKGQIIGDNAHLEFARIELDRIRKQLQQRELELSLMNEVITPELMIEKLCYKVVVKPSLLKAYDELIAKRKTLVGIELSEKTHYKDLHSIAYFKAFLKQVYGRNDLTFAEVKAKLGVDYFHWLRTEKKCGIEYSKKTVKRLAAVINYAIIQDYTQTNPIAALTFKNDRKKQVVYLSVEQLKRLANTTFEAVPLNIVKDVFLFQCYTGMAYVDVKDFSIHNIQVDTYGKQWIIINRAKTGGRSTIPILPEAQALIEKYTAIDKYSLVKTTNRGLFPVYPNAVMNRILKQIGLITGIGAEIMSTHTARKTFATTALNTHGISIETVSAILGHASIKMTQQYYARVNQTKIAREIQNLQLLTN